MLSRIRSQWICSSGTHFLLKLGTCHITWELKRQKNRQLCCGSPMHFMKFFCRTLESLVCSDRMQNNRAIFQRNNEFLQLHSLNSGTFTYRINRRRTNVQLLHAALCHSLHGTVALEDAFSTIPNFSPCNYYLWRTPKNIVYVNCLQKLEDNTPREIANISRQSLSCVKKYFQMVRGMLKS